MYRGLVESRTWISEAEYQDGVAVATICPGPLAYQVGVVARGWALRYW